MKRIVLISCSSKKKKIKSKAETLYDSNSFRKSLEYARLLKPDKIFIISALHYLLSLDQEIEPYEVTLTSISKIKRIKNPQLKVLNRLEKKEWGKTIIEQLKRESDIKNDEIIILAGKDYIEPIENEITRIVKPLEGVKLFDRISTLKRLINEESNQ